MKRTWHSKVNKSARKLALKRVPAWFAFVPMVLLAAVLSWGVWSLAHKKIHDDSPQAVLRDVRKLVELPNEQHDRYRA